MGIGHRTITLDRLAQQQGAQVNSSGVVVLTPELQRARSERLSALEESARKYEASAFSPGVYSFLSVLDAAGSTKARLVRKWIVNLWTVVGQRRALIQSASTAAEVNNVPIDFAVLSVPAVTPEQLVHDAAHLLPELIV